MSGLPHTHQTPYTVKQGFYSIIVDSDTYQATIKQHPVAALTATPAQCGLLKKTPMADCVVVVACLLLSGSLSLSLPTGRRLTTHTVLLYYMVLECLLPAAATQHLVLFVVPKVSGVGRRQTCILRGWQSDVCGGGGWWWS